MFTRLGFVSAAVAALVFAFSMGPSGGAMATQSVDPCYKACYQKKAGASQEEKQDCSRRCRASDRYICDSKCIRTIGNYEKQKACRFKCVGLPGGW